MRTVRGNELNERIGGTLKKKPRPLLPHDYDIGMIRLVKLRSHRWCCSLIAREFGSDGRSGYA
jgi:hypothetical protein